jgi:metal-responsive CopG/Arc/MetJ family transcriptional regulator
MTRNLLTRFPGTIQAKLTRDLAVEVAELAQSEGETISCVVRAALRHYLKDRKTTHQRAW